MEFLKKLNFNTIKSESFKEDSVREEIISPILSHLGFSAFGKNTIIRSQNLKHPYIYFGTKKETINIIPDYLLQVNGINKVIIDAKSPREQILKGKNPEQAYSYAIHKEVRVELYCLCNGIEFVIFSVNEIEPIFYTKIEDLETNWKNMFEILSPLGLTEPHVFNFQPDFGIRLLKTGMKPGFKQYFLGAWLNSLSKLDDETYTFTSVIPYGNDCLGSFDFNKELLNDFLLQVPESKKELVKNSITCYPFKLSFDTQESSFEIAFQCELQTQIIELEHDLFSPLKIIEFIKI